MNFLYMYNTYDGKRRLPDPFDLIPVDLDLLLGSFENSPKSTRHFHIHILHLRFLPSKKCK